MTQRTVFALFALLLVPLCAAAQTASLAKPDPAYVLGPEDQLIIRVLDIEELPDKPFRIDMRGNLNLPIAGRVHAGGLTIEQLEAVLVDRFGKVLQHPTVTIFITEFRSQPVSVLGSVRNPGVHQIRGSKTLYEVLSLAGGQNPMPAAPSRSRGANPPG